MLLVVVAMVASAAVVAVMVGCCLPRVSALMTPTRAARRNDKRWSIGCRRFQVLCACWEGRRGQTSYNAIAAEPFTGP